VVEVASRPVRFVFTAPDAETVSIAGSWNDWQPEAAPMVRGEGGRFYAEIELGTGQYEYQFVVDGERWVADPAAALARDDGFGRKNSVITI
jgi:1,4-alpha-glucan branching enzyme